MSLLIVPDPLCTTCQHVQSEHILDVPPCASCGCFEFRNAPDDTVLACVLRLVKAAEHPEQDYGYWETYLRAYGVPLLVPATRWHVDIARLLACAGICVAYDADAGPVSKGVVVYRDTMFPCLPTALNGA